jgi:hypothetical protein
VATSPARIAAIVSMKVVSVGMDLSAAGVLSIATPLWAAVWLTCEIMAGTHRAVFNAVDGLPVTVSLVLRDAPSRKQLAKCHGKALPPAPRTRVSAGL